MDNDLTYDEIELTQKALEYYSQNGIQKEFETDNLVAFAECLIKQMDGDDTGARQHAQQKEIENRGKKESFKDRLILIQAKLIHMKDQIILSEVIDEIS